MPRKNPMLRPINEDNVYRLHVHKTVNYKDLPEADKKKLPSYVTKSRVNRVFYTDPMFNQCAVGKEDLILEVVSDEETPWDIDASIIDAEGNERIEKWHQVFCFVYNSVAPEFSEFGTVTFDENFENRIVE